MDITVKRWLRSIPTRQLQKKLRYRIFGSPIQTEVKHILKERKTHN
jgi:hypothetical protein